MASRYDSDSTYCLTVSDRSLSGFHIALRYGIINLMTTYTVRIRNPIIDREVMKIETEDRGLALSEAEYYSKRHGLAQVFDDSSNIEVARFRYGVEETVQQ